MGVVRGDEDDEVGVRLAEHLGERPVGLDAREVGRRGAEPLRVELGHRDGRQPGLPHLVEMVAAHVEGAAVADDAHLDLLLRLVFLHEREGYG